MASALLTRRELTLLLFALTIFLVAFNFESAVRPLRRVSTSASAFSARTLLAFHVQGILREDGRRVPQFTDELEQEILGDWEIEKKSVYDLGPAGIAEDQQHREWKSGAILSTELVAHVPGFTILDNVLLLEGTLYLVHDHAAQVFPRQEAMLSAGLDSPNPAVMQDLKFLTRHQALETLGYSAHRLTGSSVLCLDHPSLIDNQTLVAFHRAYATLADPSDLAPILPPARTIFTNTKKLALSQTGYDLKLSRIAFPYMVHLFSEDWDDFERSARPMLFDRILLVDRVAAELASQAFDFSADVVSPRARVDIGADATQRRNKKANKFQKSAMAIEATDKRLPFAPAFAFPVRPDWAEPLS
ncbi:hypothetical protein EW145_g6229, partial [Phellinidium pouzarii]